MTVRNCRRSAISLQHAASKVISTAIERATVDHRGWSMSTIVSPTSESRATHQTAVERQQGSPRFVAAAPGRRTTDSFWAPRHASVGIVNDEYEAKLVHQLRYRVYVHELGVHPENVDSERDELVGQLDPWSFLWYARENGAVVGTIAQTIIGPDFDLSRIPSALELDSFPRSATRPIGFSSRFAIAPDHRSTWVLPSLARHTYAHGRELGAKFDFMVTAPSLVPLFERLGYVRYTESAFHMRRVGLLLPMVLPATDHEHLRNVRSAFLPSTAYFRDEPGWGEWLRATRPIIGVYYGSDARREERAAVLAQRMQLPVNIAVELSSMSFVHHFPAGTLLLREGDRVTCSFLALDGQLSHTQGDGGEPGSAYAPDGVAFSRATIRCETDAAVLSLPDSAFRRLMRRHPEHGARLQGLFGEASGPGDEDARLRR